MPRRSRALGSGFEQDVIDKYIAKAGKPRYTIEMRDAPPIQHGEDAVAYQYRTGLPLAIVLSKFRQQRADYANSEEGKAEAEFQRQMKAEREYEASLTPAQRKRREEATVRAFKEGINTGIAEQVAHKAKGYIDTASNASAALNLVGAPAKKAYDAAKLALDVGYNLMGIDDDQSNQASTDRVAQRILDVRSQVGGCTSCTARRRGRKPKKQTGGSILDQLINDQPTRELFESRARIAGGWDNFRGCTFPAFFPWPRDIMERDPAWRLLQTRVIYRGLPVYNEFFKLADQAARDGHTYYDLNDLIEKWKDQGVVCPGLIRQYR